jgi:hypothetical protein
MLTHNYIEVAEKPDEKTFRRCLYTYSLGYNPSKQGAIVMSPDFAVLVCRSRAEKCLQAHAEGNDYTYEGNSKKRSLTLTRKDGCNRVCIGIDNILDNHDITGNNNLPRGFIIVEGRLNRAQVEILRYIHLHGEKYSDGVTRFETPHIKYSLVPSISSIHKKVDNLIAKGSTLEEIFHNCQTFARDFCYRPERLYSQLYSIPYNKELYDDKGLGKIYDEPKKAPSINTLRNVLTGKYAWRILQNGKRAVGAIANGLGAIGENMEDPNGNAFVVER